MYTIANTNATRATTPRTRGSPLWAHPRAHARTGGPIAYVAAAMGNAPAADARATTVNTRYLGIPITRPRIEPTTPPLIWTGRATYRASAAIASRCRHGFSARNLRHRSSVLSMNLPRIG